MQASDHCIIDTLIIGPFILPGTLKGALYCWIGHQGPTKWPAHSPDLNPLDFYLWGHLKAIVYSTPIHNMEILRQRIEQG